MSNRVLIGKSWTFEAAHRLPCLPKSHKCHRLHGHTYKVEVHILGVPDTTGATMGMVVDYDELDASIGPVIAFLDHQYLNEVPELEAAPTTELVAQWLHDRIAHAVLVNHGLELGSVRLYESATTWAECGKLVDRLIE